MYLGKSQYCEINYDHRLCSLAYMHNRGHKPLTATTARTISPSKVAQKELNSSTIEHAGLLSCASWLRSRAAQRKLCARAGVLEVSILRSFIYVSSSQPRTQASTFFGICLGAWAFTARVKLGVHTSEQLRCSDSPDMDSWRTSRPLILVVDGAETSFNLQCASHRHYFASYASKQCIQQPAYI